MTTRQPVDGGDSRAHSDPQYSLWGNKSADRHHAGRQAEQEAAFALPHLASGIHLLDCGCGPGSITVGLARVVAPGDVIGIDLDLAALERAKRLVHDKNVTNVRFDEGNVYALPFADNRFDAVFSHALFEHLEDPLKALNEIHRVTKSGGVVALRVPDHDGWLIHPQDPLMEQYIAAIAEYRARHGADMRRGKGMRTLMRLANFDDIYMTASYDSHSSPAEVRSLVESLFPPGYVPDDDPMVEAGIVDLDTMAAIAEMWRKWSLNPDAFLARSFCEVLARKA